jgi:hypothetical protein
MKLFHQVKSRTDIGVRESKTLEDVFKADKKVICDAVNCSADATNTIEVEAGNHRTISLSLCNDCICKFSDENETQYKK